LEQSVAHWVLSGGAMALMVPAVTKDGLVLRSDLDLADYAAALDGLVLQGGNDVAPECYGEQPLRPEWAGDAVRDRYEIELIDAFVQAGKPVFGICRGLQLINVMFGGSLWQDTASQVPGTRAHRELGKYEHHYHAITLEPGTRLAQLYPGVVRATTNSIHHQSVKALAPGFVVEARCPDDGTVEAIRRTGPGYVAAVQWHPEFHEPDSPDDFDDSAMLRDFLDACRSVKARR
ncbi:MAG: gamma-glutamyl-gamma-aminobutyrate hydrolase family protein, partial [Comamonadaceae bacterium]|nr:gamma-glutamyl-gamma-aminobutyrate hydrolase family protein [Comamonadaceae bacterium]